MALRKKELFGEILIGTGKLKKSELTRALEEQKTTKLRLGEILLKLGLVDEETIVSALAEQLGIPYVRISGINISSDVIALVPIKLAHRFKLIPVKKQNNILTIAMSNPFDITTIDEIRVLTDCEIEVVISTETEIMEAIKKYYGTGAETVQKMVEEKKAEKTPAVKVVEKPEEAAVIKFVNQIVNEAYKSGATDIHIEPFESELRVRYRIDGVLSEANLPALSPEFAPSIISRLKIIANMNISEKRLPQDGRIKVEIGREHLDLRVSTIPTLYGESLNLRILPKTSVVMGLEYLGLDGGDLKKIESLLKLPNGIILVTGPTGHGKTTTLYACLNKINSSAKKIITIEDPIEYRMYGINQIQVQPKIGLTFASGLRSILRQDPDVIMVGEIRDTETAEIAIRSSLTGHLVLSTLHTNTATGAITRLLDMGIEPYLVSSSILAAIGERLIRLLCPACKERKKVLDANELVKAGFTNVPDKIKEIYVKGKGCPRCKGTGYSGRTGIYEILFIDDEIKKSILAKEPENLIRQKAISLGMNTLKDDGLRKVLSGVTTIEEVLRITGE